MNIVVQGLRLTSRATALLHHNEGVLFYLQLKCTRYWPTFEDPAPVSWVDHSYQVV